MICRYGIMWLLDLKIWVLLIKLSDILKGFVILPKKVPTIREIVSWHTLTLPLENIKYLFSHDSLSAVNQRLVITDHAIPK